MSTKDVVWSHTEALLAAVLDCDPSELSCDADGDWPVRSRSGGYWVRVLPGRRPHVEVFSRVVEDIDLDPGLLEEINDWNRRLAHANAFWRDRTVWVTGQIVGTTMELDDLGCMTEEIAGEIHRVGPRLAKRYGGNVLFPDEVEEGEV